MDLRCPRCNMQTAEMVECESCNTIGCVRCITKSGNRWLCGNCKDGKQYNQYEALTIQKEQSPESALAAMFG